jgi:ATP-dependent 26S proteasome regulatory subunit
MEERSMETTMVSDRPPATPEEIWAILREAAEMNRESERRHKELDLFMQETARWRKETEQLMRENAERQQKEAEQRQKEAEQRQREEEQRQQKEAEQRQKEAEQRQREEEQWQKEAKQRQTEIDIKFAKLQENVGGRNRSLGELIEILIAAHLWEKFPEYDLQRAYRRLPIYDEKNQAKTDIDILLVNSEWAMAVEVKHEVDVKDIDRHVVRMARILQYPPAQLTPGVKLLGAMAGGAVEPEAAAYAHQCGFFVLELAGESVIRVPAPPEFKPKEWQRT